MFTFKLVGLEYTSKTEAWICVKVRLMLRVRGKKKDMKTREIKD